jgi:hypothetical protein
MVYVCDCQPPVRVCTCTCCRKIRQARRRRDKLLGSCLSKSSCSLILKTVSRSVCLPAGMCMLDNVENASTGIFLQACVYSCNNPACEHVVYVRACGVCSNMSRCCCCNNVMRAYVRMTRMEGASICIFEHLMIMQQHWASHDNATHASNRHLHIRASHDNATSPCACYNNAMRGYA